MNQKDADRLAREVFALFAEHVSIPPPLEATLLASASKVLPCDHNGCNKSAKWCEYMHWSCGPGISFFYFCDEHWRAKGPDGTSPKERAA